MRHINYDRLTAQDIQFLIMDSASSPMDIVSVQILELPPGQSNDDGIDIDAYRTFINSILHRIPRYRQKLKWIPYLKAPVWVDDDQINLDYHIRHTALPRPGTVEQLKALASRIMVNQLDKQKPLWELWIVEGLEHNRFAMIYKIHHCILDGVGGMSLAHVLMSLTPNYEVEDAPMYIPRREPSSFSLLADEMVRMTSLPWSKFNNLRKFIKQSDNAMDEIKTRLLTTGKSISTVIHPPSDSPLNGELSYHRRCEWMEMPLADIKTIRQKLSCSLTDVALGIVTSAIRKLYIKRGLPTDIDNFRVIMPVNIRQGKDQDKLGNHISTWFLTLPIDEADPVKQIKAINRSTQELKESRQALGNELLMEVADWAPAQVLPLVFSSDRPFANSIVTSVPGPQMPLYCLGAKMLEIYPHVPLLPGIGLGTALISYNGNLFWGFNADYNLVPDIKAFHKAVAEAFDALKALPEKGHVSLVQKSSKKKA